MPTLKLDYEKLKNLAGIETLEFPKYTTQIMNLANQNAQGTRPKIVGQMSDLINEFPGKLFDEWSDWYQEKHPEAIEIATEKIFHMVQCLKVAINEIDKELVRKWVEDLVVNKTFTGMKFQQAILKVLSEKLETTYKPSNPEEEAKGIDGYIGDKPVSIKPSTYKMMNRLPENIDIAIITYEKGKTGITVDYSSL